MQGLAASQEFEVVTHAVQAAQFFLVEPSAEIEAGFATQQFARDFHRTQLGTKHGDARMDATGNADRRVVDAERGAADAQLDGSGSDNDDDHSPVVLVPTAPVVGWERNLSRDLREYVQPDNVTAIIDQPSICASTEPILLLVIICSSVDNFDARMAIRETWGSPANVSEKILRLGFLLGDTDSLEMQNQVMDESSKYGDVIQEGFLDTYNNLTLKSVMLLKWVRSHCRHARYVMKTDDDMFVNLPRLISFLQEDQAKFRPLLKHAKPSTVSLPQSTQLPDSAEATSALLIGTLICGARPISNARSKWYAPKYMYNGRTYPKYLSGTGYVMSARTVKKLFEAALRTPLFHLEDVYITGMCSRAAKIKPQDHPGFSYQKRKLEPCAYKHQLFTSHHMNSTDLRSVWGHIQNPNLVCQRVVPTVKKPPKRGKKTSICV